MFGVRGRVGVSCSPVKVGVLDVAMSTLTITQVAWGVLDVLVLDMPPGDLATAYAN